MAQNFQNEGGLTWSLKGSDLPENGKMIYHTFLIFGSAWQLCVNNRLELKFACYYIPAGLSHINVVATLKCEELGIICKAHTQLINDSSKGFGHFGALEDLSTGPVFKQKLLECELEELTFELGIKIKNIYDMNEKKIKKKDWYQYVHKNHKRKADDAELDNISIAIDLEAVDVISDLWMEESDGYVCRKWLIKWERNDKSFTYTWEVYEDIFHLKAFQEYKYDANKAKIVNIIECTQEQYDELRQKELKKRRKTAQKWGYEYKEPEEGRCGYYEDDGTDYKEYIVFDEMSDEENGDNIVQTRHVSKRRKLCHQGSENKNDENLDALKAENEELKKALKKYKNRASEYQLIAAALKDKLLNGTDPRVELYESCKNSVLGNEWTKNVKLLYDEIGDEKKQKLISEHHQKLSTTKRKSIKAFLDLNGDEADYKNPNVLKKNQQILTLNDIVSKEKIKDGHRVPELVGQFGVFAKMDIPKNLVLGRYIGFECTNKEWNEIFDHSKVDILHNPYLFTYDLDQKVDENDDGSRSVTIDPMFGKMQDFACLYINDIRLNKDEPIPTEDDKALQNCEFFTFCYKGWPVPAIVTTKKIKKGDELLLDYGEKYSSLFTENDRWKKMKNVDSKKITKHIVKDANLDVLNLS